MTQATETCDAEPETTMTHAERQDLFRRLREAIAAGNHAEKVAIQKQLSANYYDSLNGARSAR
jgi:hypothetical protein